MPLNHHSTLVPCSVQTGPWRGSCSVPVRLQNCWGSRHLIYLYVCMSVRLVVHVYICPRKWWWIVVNKHKGCAVQHPRPCSGRIQVFGTEAAQTQFRSGCRPHVLRQSGTPISRAVAMLWLPFGQMQAESNDSSRCFIGRLPVPAFFAGPYADGHICPHWTYRAPPPILYGHARVHRLHAVSPA